MTNFVKGLGEGLKFVAPIAIDATFKLSLQDQKIAKLVGGLLITLQGIELTKNGLGGRNLNSHQTKPIQTIKWPQLTLGLLATAYGIYQLMTGLLEIVPAAQAKTINKPQQDIEDYDPYSPIKFGPYKTCESRLQEIKEDIHNCPTAQQLWNKLESEKPFSIHCASFEKAPTGAFVETQTRKIFLSDLSERMTENLLFEMNNLDQAQNLRFVQVQACSKGPEWYAEQVEKIEYQTLQNTYRIAEECIESENWPAEYSTFTSMKNGDWAEFDAYLEDQKSNGHYDLYVQSWNERCKK